MANNLVASVPGIELYTDGIQFEAKAVGCLASLYALNVSQAGFTPIDHVNVMEVAVARDLNELVFAIATMPLLGLGVILLLIWIFNPKTVVRVRSDGEVFATVVIGSQYREPAQEMVSKYRRLKNSIASKRLKF